MRIRLNLVVAALVVPLIASAPPAAFGQSAKVEKVDMKAPAPRLKNGKPDFSGNWTRPFVPDITRNYMAADGTSSKGETNPLPFTPWGQKQWDNYNQVKNGDYAGSCMPFGFPRSLYGPHPTQIVQDSDYVVFLWEQNTMFHIVPTDGRTFTADLPPSWYGESIGRWDGDTLIIETRNMNGWIKLDTAGHPLSSQAKLTQTYKRPTFGTIEHTMTVDDPKTYTKPFTITNTWPMEPWGTVIMEYSCMEGNLDNLLTGTITPWKPPAD